MHLFALSVCRILPAKQILGQLVLNYYFLGAYKSFDITEITNNGYERWQLRRTAPSFVPKPLAKGATTFLVTTTRP